MNFYRLHIPYQDMRFEACNEPFPLINRIHLGRLFPALLDTDMRVIGQCLPILKWQIFNIDLHPCYVPEGGCSSTKRA